MKTIKVLEENHVLYIELHRPEVRNSFNAEMIAELKNVFTVLETRSDLRLVQITGSGKVFCSGADLEYMKSMAEFSQYENEVDAKHLYDLFAAMAAIEQPVLIAAQGAAFGGALGMLACADYVIATDNLQMCFSEVKLGLVPAVISSFLMRKISAGFLQPLMMSGEVFGSEQALRMGLVHEICLENETSTRLEKVRKNFLQCGPEAVRETKKLLRDLRDLKISEHRQKTAAVIADRRVSSEGQEGLKSFFEKRKASWV